MADQSLGLERLSITSATLSSPLKTPHPAETPLNTTESKLLSLPRELRDKIWKLVVVQPKPIRINPVIVLSPYCARDHKTVTSYAKASYSRKAMHEYEKNHPKDPYPISNNASVDRMQVNSTCRKLNCNECKLARNMLKLDYVWDFGTLHLLLTNKQIYEEASTVLYHNNTFEFFLTSKNNDYTLEAFASFLMERPTRAQELIRYMAFELRLPVGHTAPEPYMQLGFDPSRICFIEFLLSHKYSVKKLFISVNGPNCVDADKQEYTRWQGEAKKRAEGIVQMFGAFPNVKEIHISASYEHRVNSRETSHKMIELLDNSIMHRKRAIRNEDIVVDLSPAAHGAWPQRGHYATLNYSRKVGRTWYGIEWQEAIDT